MTQTTSGTDWRQDELEAIVADYFEMLTKDMAGIPYVKARHRSVLRTRIARSEGSIEFKYQNISAVLDHLGIPWIPGYKPAKNYQNALIDAIDRYLTNNVSAFEVPIIQPSAVGAFADVFVAPPASSSAEVFVPRHLQNLIRKFDPAERDYRNRSLGRAGEEFVINLEQHRLHDANRADLARQVRWIAQEDGDGAGYDVLSFDVSGDKRLIEVKTTNGSAVTPFFLSRNECAVAAAQSDVWRLYRVHLFSESPRVFTLAPPLETMLKLTTQTWRASLIE